MRVAIVTESFPPDINGVSHCALQTAQHLARLVLAPAGAHDCPADSDGTHPYPASASPRCHCRATRRCASPCPAAGSSPP